MTRRVARLTLTDFRNYASLIWLPPAGISVLHGPNGSGKTNLLEAISVLVPGRGLRAARAGELTRHGAEGGWAVAVGLDDGTVLGTGIAGRDTGPERRSFRIDGVPPRNQAEVASLLAAVWLTPQMDRLFLEGPSGRRRFLDRLVFALEPAHAREIAAHDASVASRNRLLAENRQDAAWLAAVEAAVARHAVAATAARASLTRQLNEAAARGASAPFPAARLDLICPIAAHLAAHSALATEDWLRDALAASRAYDRTNLSTSLGAHRADIALATEAGQPAQSASTGQQKSMLLSLILNHASLIGATRGAPPVLLLDEPLVHLDAAHRAALFAALARIRAQTLITGTDAEVFLPFADSVAGFATGDAALNADARFGNAAPPA